MAKSVDDRGRGARMARRDEGAYLRYELRSNEASRDASAARATDLAIRGPQAHHAIDKPPSTAISAPVM
jgi:hypothetical protein